MLNKCAIKQITKQFILVATIVFAAAIITPTGVHAYIIGLKPSNFVKAYLNLLLLLTTFLLTILLVIHILFRKVKKTGSDSKSKVSKFMLKALILIGILLLISRLSLQFGFIRNLLDNNYHVRFFFNSYITYPEIIKTRKIIVVFKEGVSQEKAEEYLKGQGVEFTKTENVSEEGERIFDYSGLKYVVAVRFFLFETDKWIAKFNSDPLIFYAFRYSGPWNLLID